MGEVIFQRSLNDVIDKFRECRKDIDALISIKDKFPFDFAKLQGQITDLVITIGEMKKNLDTATLSFVQAIKDQSTSNVIFKNDLLENKKTLETQTLTLEELRLKVLNNFEKINKIEANYADKAQILEIKNEQDKNKKKFEQTLGQAISESKNNLDVLKEAQEKTLGIVHQSRDDLFKRLEDFSKDYEILKKSFADHKEFLASQISTFKASIIAQINQAISEQPKPVIPSLDDAKAAMKKELESTALDAKNANLRSGNNENEISILKKKLESALLIVKKFELRDQL